MTAVKAAEDTIHALLGVLALAKAAHTANSGIANSINFNTCVRTAHVFGRQ